MQTRRWRFAILSAVTMVVLAACEDIIVDTLDRTAPETAVAHSGRTPARFAATGEAVTIEHPVLSGQAFTLQPERASETTTLLVAARDNESAIRSISASVELTFTCSTVVPGGTGGTIEKEVTVGFNANVFTPDAAGTEVQDTEAAAISFTLNEAWQRGGCERWGQIIDVRRGQMRNIRGVVRSRAQNNALPSVGTSFTAPFTFPSSYSVSY